jgi:propanediol dehydratase small subunit
MDIGEAIQSGALDQMLELQRLEVARMRSDPEYVRAETARAERDPEYVRAETVRLQADPEFVKAETVRLQAETVRLQADAARAERDPEYVRAETVRLQADHEFVKAETVRLQAETVRLQADAARAERDPEFVKAETVRLQTQTARLKAETACLKAQSKLRAGPCPEDAVNSSTTPAATSRKRPRPVRSLEERVLAASSYPHKSMKPLSMHVWKDRPAHYTEDICTVYTLVSKWVSSRHDVCYINRPLPKFTPYTLATYNSSHTDSDFLVREFWKLHTPPLPDNAAPQPRQPPRRRETPGVPRTLLFQGQEMVSVSHDMLDWCNDQSIMPQVKWLFDFVMKWFMERIGPPPAEDAPDVHIEHMEGLPVVFTWPATDPKHLSDSHRRELLECISRAALR